MVALLSAMPFGSVVGSFRGSFRGSSSRGCLIGLGAALLSGCSEEDGPTCPGKAADETVVRFLDGYLSEGEREKVRRDLVAWERPIRSASPGLFHCFNGWYVSDPGPSPKVAGSYSPYHRTAVISEEFDPSLLGHEFCHHVDYQSEVLKGDKLSDRPRWRDLACHAHGWGEGAPENCIAPSGDIGRPSEWEEEFAGTCGEVVQNPAAGILKYAGNENTLEQARFVARSIGMSADTLAKIEARILPPVSASIRGGLSVGELYIVPSAVGSLIRNGVFALGGGAFAYRKADDGLLLVLPAANNPADRVPYSLKLPPEFSADPSFSVDFHEGTVLLSQGDRFWRLVITPSTLFPRVGIPGPWEEGTRFPVSEEPSSAIFVDGVPALFSRSHYEILGTAGEWETRAYPEEILNLLVEDNFRGMRQENESYLWVTGLNSHFLRVRWRGGELAFERMFELPTSYAASAPFRHGSRWYVADRVFHETLHPNRQEERQDTLFPLFLGIDPADGSVTPVHLDYPAEDLSYFFNSALSLMSWIPVIPSGDSLMGVSRVWPRGSFQENSEGERVLASQPAFVKFQVE